MMLDRIGEKELGDNPKHAIKVTLKDPKTRTGDLQGSASTREFTAAVIQNLG